MEYPFFRYLDKNLVAFLQETERDDVIQRLVDLCHQHGAIADKEHFYQAVLEREQIVTTGIGMGVAIPHAKLATQKSFFTAVGILEQGSPWQSLDGLPVRLIFLIGGPDNRQTEYLKILSSLTLYLKDDIVRKRLLNTQFPEEVIELFQQEKL